MLYFIVNKSSRTGRGRDAWERVKAALDEREVEYEYHMTEHIAHATELAREITSKDEEKIYLIVLGGDGTINEALNGITDFKKVYFGVIPNGSGNDFGGGLGLSKDPIEALDKIIKDYDSGSDGTMIDIGKMVYNNGRNYRYYGISAGVGLDAIVCKKTINSKLKKLLNKIHLGNLTYVILTVVSLFTMTTENAKVTVNDKKHGRFKNVIFAAAMNFRAEGGGVPMAPRADYQDGKLSVCMVNNIAKWKTFFLLPLLVMAKHERIKRFHIFNVRSVEYEFKHPVVIHTDGEYIGDLLKVRFECVPGVLRMLGLPE